LSREEKGAWLRAVLREIFAMPRKHMLAFLVATITLVIIQVEVIEGWYLIHLVELLGGMLVLYMSWATWRAARLLKRTKQEKP
jgi:threonine/homoserine/homoserine lactone efflux protein